MRGMLPDDVARRSPKPARWRAGREDHATVTSSPARPCAAAFAALAMAVCLSRAGLAHDVAPPGHVALLGTGISPARSS